jgi:HAD superfamily hydrolase (TIGR01662 family)
MSQRAVIVMGFPASGKSGISQALAREGFKVFNRDKAGGKVASLVPAFKQALEDGHDVVADNLFLTVESRAPFIAAAQAVGVPIECHWMQTSFEDCTVNACHRMFNRYGQVLMTAADIKAHPKANKDPNMFPIAAMFAAKKRLNGDKKKQLPSGKPTLGEGFSMISKQEFHRWAPEGKNKAIILDYDGTLRDDARNHGGQHPYPVDPAQVSLLPGRQAVLQKYMDEKYMLLGVTTQSGVGKGDLEAEDAEMCIEATNDLLNVSIDTLYCPHYNFPVSCFCRKPQVGLGVQLIRTFMLDPAECFYVGDRTEDKTFATRCGFKFRWAKDFFGE